MSSGKTIYQVLATKTPSPNSVGRLDDHYTVELTIDGKPLPPGAYGLRVLLADRQTPQLASRIKP
jgi:hypothetical protein